MSQNESIFGRILLETLLQLTGNIGNGPGFSLASTLQMNYHVTMGQKSTITIALLLCLLATLSTLAYSSSPEDGRDRDWDEWIFIGFDYWKSNGDVRTVNLNYVNVDFDQEERDAIASLIWNQKFYIGLGKRTIDEAIALFPELLEATKTYEREFTRRYPNTPIVEHSWALRLDDKKESVIFTPRIVVKIGTPPSQEVLAQMSLPVVKNRYNPVDEDGTWRKESTDFFLVTPFDSFVMGLGPDEVIDKVFPTKVIEILNEIVSELKSDN